MQIIGSTVSFSGRIYKADIAMRTLLLFLLLLATAYLGLVHPQIIQRSVDALLSRISKDRNSSQPMTVSRAYLLQQEKQLIFPITPGAKQLKIISNASLPMPTNTALPLATRSQSEEVGDEMQCGYALEYALTREGEVLRSGVYHFLTTLTLTPDSSGTLRAQAFFDENSLLPMDSRILDIDLHGLPREAFPEAIQFRLHNMNEPCTGAVLRIYAGTEASEQQLSFLWERLNQSQREKYAQGNVYPAAFLTPEESTNALRIQFDPLAPNGIAGRDYTVQSLHLLQENTEAAPVPELDSELSSDDLLRADQQLRLTIPLPEQGARLKLLFTPADKHASGHTDEQNKRQNSLIKVRWYGLQSNERRQWSLPWQNGQAVLEDFFASGLLEVIADLPIQAKVQDLVHESPYTWTPLHSRMFLHGKGQPAIFKIQYLDKQATPFRCTFRRIFPQGGSQENPQRDDPSQEKEQQISYSLLDKESRELRSGTLTLHFTGSAYDLIEDRYPELLLSEPQRRFFLLPPKVDRVVFSAQEDVLIAGANRPPNIPKRIRVPDDYLRKKEPGKRLWTWFPVLPDQGETKQRENEETESFLVTLQARPPEDNEAVQAGQYLWESYRPAKDWAGHYLLEPREVGSAVRQEATDALFRVLPLNRAISINLKGKFPAAKIRPRMIFSKKDQGAATLRLSVDGGKAIELPLWGKQGILPLPPLATGKRTIRCTASTPVRLLLSNCVNQPSHLLRFANKLTGKGLTFIYEKKTSDEELLSMRYSPGHAATSEIHAQLLSKRTGSGPFEQLSADHRVYLVRAAKEFPLLVLHRKEHAVAQGQRLFFRLGSDLPAGSYRLRIWENNRKPGYLQLYRVIPGRHSQRRIGRGGD